MNQPEFFINGIPHVLERRCEITKRIITLEQVEEIMKQCDRAVLPVSGDCMERAGVVDGGYVAVDFTRFPAPPQDGRADACLCYAAYPGQLRPAVMCKEYMGVWGTCQMVGTRYDLSKGKHTMNCGMEAIRIFGVVFASWDADGQLLWERDPTSFPQQLWKAPTITGGNVGDPVPI